MTGLPAFLKRSMALRITGVWILADSRVESLAFSMNFFWTSTIRRASFLSFLSTILDDP